MIILLVLIIDSPFLISDRVEDAMERLPVYRRPTQARGQAAKEPTAVHCLRLPK
jgi:hypothetical protein